MAEGDSELRGDAHAPGPTARRTPLVSVVIAAYNVSQYIGETLASVFAQTFDDYEVVVVDDGSEDAEELALALAPYRDRLVYLTQENRGLAAARNAGLRAARGRYAAFLDADDLWEPEYLKEQVGFIEGGGYDLVYTDALLFGDPRLSGRRFMEVAPSDGEVTFKSLVRGECNVIGSGVLARKEALFDAGLFDAGLRNAQDFDLWVRMALGGARLAYQGKVLVRYRYREGSLSGDAVNRVRRELRVYTKIRDAYDLKPSERAVREEVSPVSTPLFGGARHAGLAHLISRLAQSRGGRQQKRDPRRRARGPPTKPREATRKKARTSHSLARFPSCHLARPRGHGFLSGQGLAIRAARAGGHARASAGDAARRGAAGARP